jgi:hypothetical protein
MLGLPNGSTLLPKHYEDLTQWILFLMYLYYLNLLSVDTKVDVF